MTTPEHTLVGIHCALMCGLQHRYGWRAIAVAGLASNFPDWDGLPMLINMEQFEVGHRVWGHNVFAIAIAAMLFSWLQLKTDVVGNLAFWLNRQFGLAPTHLDQKHASTSIETTSIDTASIDSVPTLGPNLPLLLLVTITVFVQLIHLPCDMVVSGGSGLSDWPIRPWWPIDNRAYVFPMIPWGDVGPTLIMMAGVIVAAKLRRSLSAVSLTTLVALIVYLITRSTFA